MFTETTKIREAEPFGGWVFFDGECLACLRLARRFGPALKRRGFRLNPLQESWVERASGLSRAELMREMKLLTPSGTIIGGADAVLLLARQIPWLAPLCWLASLPGVRRLFASGYRWYAGNRYCFIDIDGKRGRSCSAIPGGRS